MSVYGLWFMVYGLRIRFFVSEFHIEDLGFRVQGSGFRIWNLDTGF